MEWQDQLIKLFMFIDDAYKAGLCSQAQRLCKNIESLEISFQDQEAMTIYIYGITRKYREVKTIYQYAKDHLMDWFPDLPSYEKFNNRLNRLVPCFISLVDLLASHLILPEWLQGQQLVDALVDSFPIILAKGPRADNAKVAREIANKGRCASKGFWYHGLKLHHLGIHKPNGLPIPQCMVLTKASEHDNTVFKEQIAPRFRKLRVFGDKIFFDLEAAEWLWELFDIEVIACNKRRSNQEYLRSDQKLINPLVSQIKQPIESFFNWLENHTDIQIASKVRSTKGALKHIYSRLAAAFFMLILI